MHVGKYVFAQITQFLPQRQFRRILAKYNDRTSGWLMSSCHNFVSVKRKTDGFLRCKFRFKFRCSFSCSFSRQGIADASIALLFWLNENVLIYIIR